MDILNVVSAGTAILSASGGRESDTIVIAFLMGCVGVILTVGFFFSKSNSVDWYAVYEEID